MCQNVFHESQRIASVNKIILTFRLIPQKMKILWEKFIYFLKISSIIFHIFNNFNENVLKITANFMASPNNIILSRP